MTSLLNKHYSGHRRATEREANQKASGKEIWRKKCGQQVLVTAGEKMEAAAQDRAGWRHCDV